MDKKIIVVGDSTSHGGVVMQGCSMALINGKPIARKGDLVSCPIHGSNPIVEGSATYALNDQWTLGGEVMTNRFDDFGGSGVDLDATTATLRVGFQF